MDPTDSFRTKSEPSESSRIQKSTESITSDRIKYARTLTHMDSNPSFKTYSEPSESSRIQKSTQSSKLVSNKCVINGAHINPTDRTGSEPSESSGTHCQCQSPEKCTATANSLNVEHRSKDAGESLLGALLEMEGFSWARGHHSGPSQRPHHRDPLERETDGKIRRTSG